MPEPGRFDAAARPRLRDLLQRWPTPASRPALFGLPVGVKDIMRVDGLPTTAGSRLPRGCFDGQESACVSRAEGGRGADRRARPSPPSSPILGPAPRATRTTSATRRAAPAAARRRRWRRACVRWRWARRPLARSFGRRPFAAWWASSQATTASRRRASSRSRPRSIMSAHLRPMWPACALAASVLAEDWQPVTIRGRPVLGVPEGPYLARASEDGLARLSRHA